jgi:PucR family transcriptional regulator, purine catabolism regulatory protein
MVGTANTHTEEAQELITRSYGVALADLLDLDVLKGTTVLAGARGVDRLVTGVNVMEVPDVVDFVRASELLVTSGYPLGDATADTLTTLIRDLVAKGLAGAGIKLGRYVRELPAQVLSLADELRFPLLDLPVGLAFDDLSHQVYALLNQRQSGVLERIDALHTVLSQIVLEGGNLDDIAAETSRVLDVGLLVTSTDGRERAAALSTELRARLKEKDMFDQTGRVRVERASRPMPFGSGEVRTMRVAGAGADLARLVCVSYDRPLGTDDVHALERAATVAALVVTREAAVSAVEHKYQGDFLRDVFLERAGDEAFVVEHAATFGWDLERSMVVLSAQIDPLDPDESPVSGHVRRAWQERFSAAWRQVCAAHDKSIPSVDFSTEVVSVLPVPAMVPVRDAVTRLIADVAGDRGGGRRPFSVGVSRVVSSLAELSAAYDQARRATTVGRRISGPKSTTWFDDLGLHRLLALVPNSDELGEFVTDVLGELAADTHEAADLRTTLQVLLDTNLNVAEAARLQFFHYNTMRYRVSKLERILGPFTSEPHLRLNVAVALQVLEMRG